MDLSEKSLELIVVFKLVLFRFHPVVTLLEFYLCLIPELSKLILFFSLNLLKKL